jgi:hypothetical protein
MMVNLMRLPRLLLLTIALAAVLVAIPVQSGVAAELRLCGSGVRAAIVACSKAKRIAAEYRRTHARTLQGYKCYSRGDLGRCELDRKLVVFRAG